MKFNYYSDNEKCFSACIVIDSYLYFFTEARSFLRMDFSTNEAHYIFCNNYKCVLDVSYPEYVVYDEEKRILRFFDEFETPCLIYDFNCNRFCKPEINDIYIRNPWSNNIDECKGIKYSISNKKWLFPTFGENIFTWSDTMKPMVYNDYPEQFHYIQSEKWMKIGWKYVPGCETESEYILSMHSTSHMPIIDKKTGNLRWIKIIFPEKDEREIWEYFVRTEFEKQIIEKTSKQFPIFMKGISVCN